MASENIPEDENTVESTVDSTEGSVKKKRGVWEILDTILTVLIITDGLAIILLVVLIVMTLKSSGTSVRDILSQHNASQNTEAVSEESGDDNTGESAPDADADADDADEETDEEEETEADIDDGSIKVTITATGDCTLGNAHVQSYDGSFNEFYDNNGADYFFKNMQEYFTTDDITLINLEGTLTDSGARVDKEYCMKGKPEYTSIMTGSSVEFCSLGNNHTYDYGEQGFSDTKTALVSAGVRYACNTDSCIYETSEGIKVGIVSVSLVSQGIDRENTLFSEIEKMKNDPEIGLIIACTHWGEERVYEANNYQVSIGHRLIDAGVDLVLGNHSHVLQSLELYNGKVIVYSLGNFCFGGNKNPTDKETAIYRQTFSFKDGELTDKLDAQIIPCMLSSHDSYNDYCPRLAVDTERASIISKLKTRSSGYSDMTIDDDGRLS